MIRDFLMFWYLRRYFRGHRFRVILATAGISLSLASICLAYGLAAWTDNASTYALAYATDSASLWIVPKGGLYLNRQADAIFSRGRFTAAEAASVAATHGVDVIERFSIGLVPFNDTKAVLFAGDNISGETLVASEDLWHELGDRQARVQVAGGTAIVSRADPALPPNSLGGSFQKWAPVLGDSSSPGYLLIRAKNPKQVATSLGHLLDARISDSPASVLGSGAQGRPTVLLLQGTLSRFNPFSFRTEFSAFVMGGTLSTVFGWTSRLIFIVGLVLAITSMLISVVERRDEIALFSALGLEVNITILFTVESILTVGIALVVAALLSTVILRILNFSGPLFSLLGPAFAMGILYATIAAIVPPLVAAQRIAGRKPAELVRRSRAA